MPSDFEERLIEEKNYSEGLIKSLPGVFYLLDTKARFLKWNNNFTDILGFSDEKMKEVTALDLFEGEDKKRIEEAINETFEKGRTTVRASVSAKDGKKKLFYFTGFLVQVDGEPRLIGTGIDISDKVEAEEKIAQSEEKYKALYSNAPLAYQSLNEEGVFRDVNPKWLEILGYSKEEVIGESFKNFLHPDEQVKFDEKFNEFKIKGDVHSVHYKIRHKQGHYVDVLFEGGIGYNPDGSFRQTYCVFEDITEKIKSDEKVNETRIMLQRIIDLLPSRIFWKDLDLKYLGCNVAFAKDAGKNNPSDLIGSDDYSMAWKDQAELYRDDDAQVINTRESRINFEEPQTTPDGKIIWLRTSKLLLTDDEGNIKGILGTYTDITEEKEVERKIRESEEKYRSLIENMPDVAWTSNDKGEAVFISPTVEKIVGYTNEEIYARPGYWFEIIHPDDISGVMENFNRFLKENVPYNIEYRIKRKDGEWIWLRDRGIKTYQKDGVLFADGLLSDITESKQQSEALESRLAELEILHKTTMDRELKMIELKEKINELEVSLKKI